MRSVRRRLGNLKRVFRHGYHAVPDYFGRAAYKLPDLRTLPGFGEAARRTVESGTSSLYYDRLYTLWSAVEECARRFGPLTIAEVGVWKGGTSRFLLDVAPDGSALHAFDTFQGHDARDVTREGEHVPGHFSDTSADAVRALIPEATLHVGRFAETCRAIAQTTLHVVHLDVDIYEPMRHALRFFCSRVVVGGIIVVDDYGFSTCPKIQQAVHEFRESSPNYDLTPNLLTGQARLLRLA